MKGISKTQVQAMKMLIGIRGLTQRLYIPVASVPFWNCSNTGCEQKTQRRVPWGACSVGNSLCLAPLPHFCKNLQLHFG